MTYFHIGFPKSASTTLQKQLFDKHSQINFLGIYPTKNIGQDSQDINSNTAYLSHSVLREFHYLMTEVEGVEFFTSDVQQRFEKLSSLHSGNSVNVFSNERFASVLFAHKDRADKARRIKLFYPDAKIIIVIRKQIDIIKSQYRDHPFDPRNLYANQKPVSVDEWVESDFKNTEISFLKSIEYFKLVKYYESLFGKNNIGVFLFEEMLEDLALFSNKLSDFLGIDANESYQLLNTQHENEGVPKKLNRYRRLRAKALSYIPEKVKSSSLLRNVDAIISKKLNKGKKEKVIMKKLTEKKIYRYYERGNQLLDVEYNLNLGKYGYFNE